MNVEHAVEVLATSKPSRFQYEREFTVVVFSGWLNSPADPQSPTTTLFAAFNHAARRAQQAGTAPSPEWLAEIFEPAPYLKLLETGFAVPMFWLVGEHTGYNNCWYSADLIRFLLTFKPKEEDKRKRASLRVCPELTP